MQYMRPAVLRFSSFFMFCYAVYYYHPTALLAAYEWQQVLEIEIWHATMTKTIISPES